MVFMGRGNGGSMYYFLCAYTSKINYAKNNRSQNWLRFFGPIWSLIAIWLQSCFFGLVTKSLGNWGRVIDRWKGLENIFPRIYYTPPKKFNYSFRTNFFLSSSD
jgi:hypothetical protein